MKFSKLVSGDNVIYRIEGNMSFDNHDSVERLRLDIKNTSSKQKYNFIWDLKSCAIIDETGLAAIVMTIAHAIRNNTNTVLCCINEQNLEILKSFHLDTQVKFCEDVSHATGDNNAEIEILDFPENGIDWI